MDDVAQASTEEHHRNHETMAAAVVVDPETIAQRFRDIARTLDPFVSSASSPATDSFTRRTPSEASQSSSLASPSGSIAGDHEPEDLSFESDASVVSSAGGATDTLATSNPGTVERRRGVQHPGNDSLTPQALHATVQLPPATKAGNIPVLDRTQAPERQLLNRHRAVRDREQQLNKREHTAALKRAQLTTAIPQPIQSDGDVR
jgi:hypothetical protein